MAMLKDIISKINTSAGNLNSKQTGGQAIVSESHALSALTLHLVTMAALHPSYFRSGKSN